MFLKIFIFSLPYTHDIINNFCTIFLCRCIRRELAEIPSLTCHPNDETVGMGFRLETNYPGCNGSRRPLTRVACHQPCLAGEARNRPCPRTKTSRTERPDATLYLLTRHTTLDAEIPGLAWVPFSVQKHHIMKKHFDSTVYLPGFTLFPTS